MIVPQFMIKERTFQIKDEGNGLFFLNIGEVVSGVPKIQLDAF